MKQNNSFYAEMRKIGEQQSKVVDFSLACEATLDSFLEKAIADGAIKKYSKSKNADCISVKCETAEDAETLRSLWKNRFKSNAGRKAIDGVKHLWVVPQDIHEVAKEKGIQYLWDAVRFKVKFDKMGGE